MAGLLRRSTRVCGAKRGTGRFHGMDRQIVIALTVAVMIAVIVGVDVAFFRNRFWERLIANIGIVLLFAAFYARFFGRPW